MADDIALLGCVGDQSHRACLCSLDSSKTKEKNEIRISAAKISEYLGILFKDFHAKGDGIQLKQVKRKWRVFFDKIRRIMLRMTFIEEKFLR